MDVKKRMKFEAQEIEIKSVAKEMYGQIHKILVGEDPFEESDHVKLHDLTSIELRAVVKVAHRVIALGIAAKAQLKHRATEAQRQQRRHEDDVKFGSVRDASERMIGHGMLRAYRIEKLVNQGLIIAKR